MSNLKIPLTAVALGALILAGCETLSGGDEGRAPAFFRDALALPFETVEQESYGNYEVGAQNRVIRNAAVFRDFWNRLNEGQNPKPPVPEIDFSREMIIATVLGTKPSGGYAAEITDVAAGADRVGILVTKRRPGSDCGVTAALTNPYHIVRMERSALEAEFFEDEVIENCSE